MTLTTGGTTTQPPPSSTPRLRMEPTRAAGTLLDGGWWPRSTDPAAELPGLVLAIDKVRGPIIRLILSADGWDPRPRRLAVANRVVRLGYFASQPITLLTARCSSGDRVDLLVIAPDADRDIAEAAMALAAAASNLIHAQDLLAAAVGTPSTSADDDLAGQVWETEGGHLHAVAGRPRPG